jgi:hypothetical protein
MLRRSAHEDVAACLPCPASLPACLPHRSSLAVEASSGAGHLAATQPCRTGLGKLLFRTVALCQSVLAPDVVVNKVCWRGLRAG